MLINRETRKLINLALKEDMPKGDITTALFVGEKQLSEADVFAKENMVVCGVDVFEAVFKAVDKDVQISKTVTDGQWIAKGHNILKISGRKSSILQAERVALNFLQHLSGIATKTRRLVHLLEGTKTVLLDTRKTIPGMRRLQKEAVLQGGGSNHRMSLSDMVLIKDNHLQGVDQHVLGESIKKAHDMGLKVEIECRKTSQLLLFMELGVDVIMLDNMTPAEINTALEQRQNQGSSVRFEISGNITEKNLSKFAKLGVDFISTGSITHSVVAADISLLIR